MPAPLANEIRRQIVNRHEEGETLKAISESLNLSYNTVRKIWSHWRKHGQLSPNYEQAKQKGTREYPVVYEEAIDMKRQHPRWGAQLIRLELGVAYPTEKLPSVRTLQRWFKQAGVNRASKVKHNGVSVVQRGKAVHEVWAVDAREQMKLGDGSYASWLTLTDEASGSILGCETFSPQTLESNHGDTGSSQLAYDV